MSCCQRLGYRFNFLWAPTRKRCLWQSLTWTDMSFELGLWSNDLKMMLMSRWIALTFFVVRCVTSSMLLMLHVHQRVLHLTPGWIARIKSLRRKATCWCCPQKLTFEHVVTGQGANWNLIRTYPNILKPMNWIQVDNAYSKTQPNKILDFSEDVSEGDKRRAFRGCIDSRVEFNCGAEVHQNTSEYQRASGAPWFLKQFSLPCFEYRLIRYHRVALWHRSRMALAMRGEFCRLHGKFHGGL